MEEWRDIEGYEGLYQISSLGQVKSLGRKTPDTIGRVQYHEGRILKQKKEKNGYYRVQLWKNSVGTMHSVHRLVANAFIPNPDNLPQVNHKDEDKANNYYENLEWCDQAYNNTYGTRIQRVKITRKAG